MIVCAGLVALLGMAVLITIGILQWQSHQPVVLPTPGGSWRVGRIIYDWTDASRPDPFASTTSTPRELAVWIWYPADPGARGRVSSYEPAALIHGLGDGTPFHTSLVEVTPHAIENAPVHTQSEPFQLLVFAPGLGLDVASYTTIAEDLASDGYIVAGANPTYSTDVAFSDGRVVRSVPRARDLADPRQIQALWANDLRFVADKVLNLTQQSDSPFFGVIETRRLGYFGHSIGGAAATEACLVDLRCVGAADLDGNIAAGEVLHSGLKKPFPFLGHESAIETVPGMRDQLRAVLQNEPPGLGYVLSVAGTQHDNFTDRSVTFNFLGRQLGVLGAIDGSRALKITATYLHAFFQTAFSQGDNVLLDRPSSDYPEVHIETI